MEPQHGDRPHLPGPSLYPIGFAVGVACILVGLIVNPKLIAPIGAAIAIVFGFLWARDATMDYRREPEPIEPERAEPPVPDAPPIPAHRGEAAMPEPEPGERFPRSRFLEASTLGLGAVIGGLVTVPVVGFMVVPAFKGQGYPDVDLGPLDNFPEGKWLITTFYMHPEAGNVSRRTAYIRNNGQLNGEPSFTIISNRCAHLGCPVQPNGPVQPGDKKQVTPGEKGQKVTLLPTIPAGGFGCPCHGGQYDPEGNRTAGPPVRALDRYEFSVVDGHLVLGKPFSVSHVDGEGKNAKIHKYKLAGPGQHVDGWEQILYPIQPPH
jgi:quinol---cytochrome c reductase iron-sulfur subunit, bacillus type